MEIPKKMTGWPPPGIKQSIFSLHTAVLNGIAVFFYSTQKPISPLSPLFYILHLTTSPPAEKQIRFFSVGNKLFLTNYRIRAPPIHPELKNKGWRKTKVRILKNSVIFEGDEYAGFTYYQLRRRETGPSNMDKLFPSQKRIVFVMRFALYLAVPLLSASGKDGKMKKLIEFEYDFWTTEDDKCMVRVRLTGEECEVDRETFRLLRAEEKRLRRKKILEKRDDLPNEAARHTM